MQARMEGMGMLKKDVLHSLTGPLGSPSEQVQVDHKAPWLAFTGPTMIADTATGRIVRAPGGEIDEYWCFVRTASPFAQGTRINIQIARDGELFSALGRVTYVAQGGMGIVFASVEAESREILRQWLRIGTGRISTPDVKLAS
jgi:hypothetical protein